MTDKPERDEIADWYRSLQDRLCAAVLSVDGGAAFGRDLWDRPGGGGGDTRILHGTTVEKAAVNFSAVWGESPPLLRDRGEGNSFFATGVSMIVHPRNPHAPTFHANVRYFETELTSWYGGGADLTPWYINEADIRHFHTTLSDVCARHSDADYPAWKQACDDYFYIPHRQEARGVGGIFFDHSSGQGMWDFQQDLADTLMPAYLPILEQRHTEPYGPRERAWQEFRRGRYAEFNLAWDRGTRFGLETGGRAESILASLPPIVTWGSPLGTFDNSSEQALVDLLKGPPRNWLS